MMKPDPNDKAQVEQLIDMARDLLGGENADPNQIMNQLSAPPAQPRSARQLSDIQKVADFLSSGSGGLPFKPPGSLP